MERSALVTIGTRSSDLDFCKLDANIAKDASNKISKGDLVKLAVANEKRVGKSYPSFTGDLSLFCVV